MEAKPMRTLAVALVFGGALLAAAPAQARFGKHSESSDSKDDDSSSKEHQAQPAPPQHGSDDGRVHEARPAPAPGNEPSGHGSDDGGRPGGHHHGRHEGRGFQGGHHHFGWGFGYSPFFDGPGPAAGESGWARPTSEQDAAPAATVTLGMSGQLHDQRGLTLGAEGAVEGRRWGVRTAYSGILVPAEGGEDGELDAIHLLDLHLTYAVISEAHGRLRIELGATSAFAPDVIFLAPDAGLSVAAGIVGPLGFQAALSYTPWPFQRIDATAALTLALGEVGVKAGWRHLWLDDCGAVDGVRHTDTFTGPFVGVEMAF